MSPEEQKKLEDLQTQVTTLTKKNEELNTQLTQATTVVAELKIKLAEKASGKAELPTLKVGEDTYQFLSEFHYKGQEITLELLKEDAALTAELLKIGVADLRKVVAKA